MVFLASLVGAAVLSVFRVELADAGLEPALEKAHAHAHAHVHAHAHAVSVRCARVRNYAGADVGTTH